MDINLLDRVRVGKWISQFSKKDKKNALKLIEEINFIDQFDYDLYTDLLVKEIEKKSKKFEFVYLIPINSLNPKKKEPKSDSALVFNMKKKFGQKSNIFWSFDKTIRRKSVVFFIDEFIGSGGTIVKNLNMLDESTLKRIRSLTSFKSIKVCIVSIVIYDSAINFINKNFSFIDDYINKVKGTHFEETFIKNNFYKYLKSFKCKDKILGFDNTCSNIVFYNNCPNNTPSILWCKQDSKHLPLFFDKKVKLNFKTSYYNLKKEYQRLINYVEEDVDFYIEVNLMKRFSNSKGFSTLMDSILYLSMRNKLSKEKFLFFSKIDSVHMKEITNYCFEYGFILYPRSNSRLTVLGKKIIDKFSELYESFNKNNNMIEVDDLIIKNKVKLLYYPTQIKGNKINV